MASLVKYSCRKCSATHTYFNKLNSFTSYATGTNSSNNPWLSVLSSGQKIGFRCAESQKLFAKQKNNLDSLAHFHEKFPFVRKLLVDASRLNHPLRRFASHMNYQGQHLKLHGENLHLNRDGQYYSNFGFQVQENLFIPTITLLLVNKSFNNENKNPFTHGEDASILERQEQRQVHLVQAVQMLYLSQRIHQTVRNCYPSEGTRQQDYSCGLDADSSLRCIQKKENDKGNKIATLIGDLFITEMFNMLSKVENNEVVNIMSETLAEFSQENFFSSSDSMPVRNNRSLDDYYNSDSKGEPSSLKTTFKNSTKASELLFANSFSCCAILNGEQPNNLSKLGSLFGKLYFLHNDALYLIELLCSSNQATPEYDGEATSNSEEIMVNLNQDFDQLRRTTDELSHFYKSMSEDSTVLLAFEALINYLSFKKQVE